ncbi:MAG: hypothetical protein HY320_10445 [Armatimonadetes bacterium]|nr:hypothetical protein [Armatimonadota bacterium]
MQSLLRPQFLDLRWDAERVSALGDLWRDWFRIRYDRALGWSSSVYEREYRFWGLPMACLDAGEAALRARLPREGPFTHRTPGADILSIRELEQGIHSAAPLGEWLPPLHDLPYLPLWLQIRLSLRSRTPAADWYRLLLWGELAPAGTFLLRAITTESGGDLSPDQAIWAADPAQDELLAALATRDHALRQVWITTGQAAEKSGAYYPYQAQNLVEAQLLALLVQQLGDGGFTARAEEGVLTTDLPLDQLASLVAAVRHQFSLMLFWPNRKRRWMQRSAMWRDVPLPGAACRRVLLWRAGLATLLLGGACAFALTIFTADVWGAIVGASAGCVYTLLQPFVRRVVLVRRTMGEQLRLHLAADRYFQPLPADDTLDADLVMRKHAADAQALNFTARGDWQLAMADQVKVRVFAAHHGTVFLLVGIQPGVPQGAWWPSRSLLCLISYLEGGLRLITLNQPALDGGPSEPHPARVRSVPDCRNLVELWECHQAHLKEAAGDARAEAISPEEFFHRQEEEFRARAEWRRQRGYCTWREAIRWAFDGPTRTPKDA